MWIRRQFAARRGTANDLSAPDPCRSSYCSNRLLEHEQLAAVPTSVFGVLAPAVPLPHDVPGLGIWAPFHICSRKFKIGAVLTQAASHGLREWHAQSNVRTEKERKKERKLCTHRLCDIAHTYIFTLDVGACTVCACQRDGPLVQDSLHPLQHSRP